MILDFLLGEMVKCKKSDGMTFLTHEHLYIVAQDSVWESRYVCVYDDDGEKRSYLKERFVSVLKP